MSELKQRNQRIAHLETAILSAKRTPAEILALTEKIEETAREIAGCSQRPRGQTDLREVFLTLLPNGLTSTADRSPDGARQVWRITGEASFANLVEPSGPDYVATPTGFEGDPNGAGSRVSARKDTVDPPSHGRFEADSRHGDVASLATTIERLIRSGNWLKALDYCAQLRREAMR